MDGASRLEEFSIAHMMASFLFTIVACKTNKDTFKMDIKNFWFEGSQG